MESSTKVNKRAQKSTSGFDSCAVTRLRSTNKILEAPLKNKKVHVANPEFRSSSTSTALDAGFAALDAGFGWFVTNERHEGLTTCISDPSPLVRTS